MAPSKSGEICEILSPDYNKWNFKWKENMKKIELQLGDIVQLSPEHEKFPGFLLVVTEPKEWGAMGYLMSQFQFDATRFKGVAYLRAKFEEFEFVGKIHWLWESSTEEESND